MLGKYLRALHRLAKASTMNPRLFVKAINAVPWVCSAYSFSRTYTHTGPKPADFISSSTNPLREYVQNHKEGLGINKWEHYYDIYHRHFAHLVGQQVNILEIGIDSGGSLEMWRSYFGHNSHVYGVDIREACKAYENDHVSVFIGDQADRSFWNTFRKSVEGIDILIDDGGHTTEQQQTTLEEMLPYLRPGGVYLCEDVHRRTNRFAAFASALVEELNFQWPFDGDVSRFQSSIHSIHFYPYIVVIEKHRVLPKTMTTSKYGTDWLVAP